MKGYIDSVYNGSAVDGKGLRVVVFFAGCNLRCPFCHNPETLYKKGEEIELLELFKKILRYKSYIKEGGVTLSGGEPFMQAKFSVELIKKLHAEDIEVLIETNGYLIDSDLMNIADGFICDVKNQESDDYEVYDKFLGATSKDVILTCVIVPTVNDCKVKNLLLLKNRHKNVKEIKLLPFRKLCVDKYKKLNLEYKYDKFDECNKNLIDKLYSEISE